MKKIWSYYITREDLEVSPGILDDDAIQEVSLNTYLNYIEDLVELGINTLPDVSYEKMEDTMVDNYMCIVHALEGRDVEPEEIHDYIRQPENTEALRNLTYLCTNVNKDTLPEIERQLREMLHPKHSIDWNRIEERIRIDKANQKYLKKMLEDGYAQIL